MHTILITTAGLPFSGKTTLARAMATELYYEYISYDEIWEQERQKYDRWLSWEEVTAIAHRQIENALQSDSSVIYDNLGDTVWYRKELETLASANGAAFLIVFCNTTDNDRLLRSEANKLLPNRHHISRRRLLNSKEFEPIAQSELTKTIFYLPTMPSEEVIELVRARQFPNIAS